MSDQAYEQIGVDDRERVRVITLRRPERMNAWTPRMSAELSRAIGDANDDPDVGAMVITGEGRGFCAGADISAVFDAQLSGADASDADGHMEPDGGGSTAGDWVGLLRSSKPVVAAVNGAAIGVGLTMILPVDRIVTVASAKFSLRFVKMGVVPELASSHFLPARVGFGAASDLMLSGRTILGDEAQRLGLADEVVDPDDLLAVAIERAREYGDNPAPQLRWIKELLTQNATETDLAAVQRREFSRLQEAYATQEHKDAVAAFLSRD